MNQTKKLHLVTCSNLARLSRQIRLLQQATKQLETVFPLDSYTFNPDSIDPELLLKIDGYRTRFADLQDMIGQVMFKNIALLDQDESSSTPLSTIKRNALMEKRNIIQLEKWQEIRNIRNGFAHEYPDEHQEKAIYLNRSWAEVKALIVMGSAVEEYICKNHGIGEDSCA